MSHYIKNCLLLLILSVSKLSFGQTSNIASFEFADAMCSYKGYYDPAKYNPKQLENTYRLISESFGMYDDNIDDLNKNYRAVKSFLSDSEFVKDGYFLKIRDSIAQFIEETYVLMQVRLKAKEEPKGLLVHHMDVPKVSRYAKALNAGGAELLAAYEEVTKRSMEVNIDPDRIWNRYQDNIRSNSKYQTAFEEVLIFGWWNTINESIQHYNIDLYAFDRYNALFVKVDTLDCDE